MSGQDEAKVYEDLIGFLKSDRDDLRLVAVNAVSGVEEQGGRDAMIKHGIVGPLARNCSRPGPIGVTALLALVHLSSRGPSATQCVEDCLDAGALSRMTEIVLSKREDESEESWRKRVNYAMALLANMTRTERGAVDLVGRTLPEEAVSSEVVKGDGDSRPSKPTLELLLARFLSTQYIQDNEEDEDLDPEEHADNLDELGSRYNDPFQHFAAVLMNATQLEAGRKFVLRIKRDPTTEATTSVLQAILSQLRSKNPIRRRGVAGTVKNVCLESDAAWWLLEEVKVLKFILYPLAGPEELEVDEKRGMDPDLWLEGPDKVREPDHFTRLFLVESILLLCASGRRSREKLRLERVYVVLKMADMVEEHEDVSERINECVQYLRRDEQGTEEGSSDRMVEDSLGGAQRLRALPAASTAHELGGGADFDDVD